MGPISEPLLQASSAHQCRNEEMEAHWTASWWREAKKQLDLAGSMVVASLLQYSMTVISTMFVGHLGELELSGASVATSFAGVTGFTVLTGLSSGLETLCGQAYGAKSYHLLSVYFQAAVLVLISLSVPVTILWLNMETILLALGQDPDISRVAGNYFSWLWPALFSAAIIQPLLKFMQSQSLVLPMLYCSLLTMMFHIPTTYLLIHVLGFGYVGGAMGVSISYFINVVLLLVYVHFSKQFEKTWRGPSKEVFGAFTPYMKLAIPSAAMICLEYWAFEVLVIFAGLLPNPQLQVSLLSICLTTGSLTYMIAIGLGSAVSVRVSNELGAGRPSAAKFAGRVVVGLALIGSTCIATIEILVRNQWGKAFSDEKEVVQAVARVMPLLAIAVCLDGVQGVLSGVARGCGWQEAGAWVNLASFYVVGLPTAIMLGYHFKFGALGLWLGFYSGLVLQLISLIILTALTNWEKMVENAEKRVRAPVVAPTLPLTLPLLA